MKLRQIIAPYNQAVPKLIFFNIVTSLLLVLCTKGLGALSDLLLDSAGKVSVSSGDYAFVFTSWQGYVLIFLVLNLVLLYVAVEVNALIVFCGDMLDGRKPTLRRSVLEGFKAMRHYACPRGLIVIIYATLISPLLGLGFSISLTQSFYIPNFIRSVIDANPLTRYALVALLLVLLAILLLYCFLLPGVLLDGKSMKQASKDSRILVLKNLKSFLFNILSFILGMVICYILALVVFIFLPLLIVNNIPMDEQLNVFFNVFFSDLGAIAFVVLQFLFSSFMIIKLLIMYRRYSSEEQWSYYPRVRKHHPVIILISVFLVLLLAAHALITSFMFDELYPPEITTGVVAHRAGGVEAPENTVKGIEAAIALGADGAEIDIQRTKDGYYIVNHDDTFNRVAGVNSKPSDMTLAEIKSLRVAGEQIPTLEETLEACRDNIMLFVELKGKTADLQMADDAVRIIKEMGMEGQTVLISLKFNVLDYIERNYPEMQTGYLAFFSFGKLEKMPFDYFAVEEEIATDEAIEAIHEQNKKVMVWTVNTDSEITRFLQSEADAIITDQVRLSEEQTETLENRTPVERIVDRTISLFFE